ncbi:MAG: IS66 family insertion sequence element accessory protein TnpB [Deltaproteobacteria bacterium]|nr:IS66 family insertion sequence element accessory protein TnpB [Deltaproteobacteria bacterium]
MLILEANLKVYIATGSTDMRKAINGLSILVESRMELDPFSGHIFVFSNKRRNMIKVLYWEHNGFCLWQKRLERERFRWPQRGEEVMRISPRELRWLLDGLEVVQGSAHRPLQYSSVM